MTPAYSYTTSMYRRKRVCHIFIVQQLWRSEVGITAQHCCLEEQNLVFAAVL